MCISPKVIPNPNYHSTVELIIKTTDTQNKYLEVPCGVCVECMFKRQSDLVCRVRNMLRDNYLFFFTLTYNDESLPQITTSTGDTIPFADVADVQKMMKRIRRHNLLDRPFKYLVVSERGGQRGRPHFHGLLFVTKQANDDILTPAILEKQYWKVFFNEWRRNYGSTRVPIWKPLFTYHRKYVGGRLFQNFDFHYVVSHTTESGADDVAFYVTKYILKPSKMEEKLQQRLHLTLEPEEYAIVWKHVRSQALYSQGLGASSENQIKYVKGCIEKSQDDPHGFQYYSSDGQPHAMPRYYRKYVKPQNAIRSHAAITKEIRSMDSKVKSLAKGNKIREKVSIRDISEITNF